MKDLNEEIRIEEALNKNGFLISTFKGISMLPLLDEQNDLVKLKKVDSLLEIDDMALFKRGDKLVLHRIIDVKDDYYEIVGDNQTVIENVSFENVIGKVVGYYKKGRYVSLDSDEYKIYLNNLERDLSKRIVYDHLDEIPKIYLDVLKLIRCVINNTDFVEELDYEELFEILDKQAISAYVFPKINKELCPKEIYDKWEIKYNLSIQRKYLYENEKENILNIFEDNKIKYLPFKEDSINNLYPNKNIRQFDNIGILVSDIDNATCLMIDKGYETKKDVIKTKCIKDSYNFELYSNLFIDNYSFSKCFNDYFKIAIKDKNNEYGYHMSNNEFYIYYITNLYKNYINNKRIIRYYLDIYYMRKNLLIDYEFCDKKFREMGINEFNEYTIRLIDVLFSDNSKLPISDVNFIFTGRAHGTYKHSIRRMIEKNGKLKYILFRIFPPYDRMCAMYKILKKVPYLLPFTYILRGFKIIIKDNSRNRLKTELRILNENDKQNN